MTPEPVHTTVTEYWTILDENGEPWRSGGMERRYFTRDEAVDAAREITGLISFGRFTPQRVRVTVELGGA